MAGITISFCIYHHLIFSQPPFLSSRGTVLLKRIIIDFVNETTQCRVKMAGMNHSLRASQPRQASRCECVVLKAWNLFSFLSWKDERSFTLIWCKEKQKHTDKHVDMKLMGSLLSNCNGRVRFYSVNPILTVIFVMTLFAFGKRSALTNMFLGVCVVSSLFLSLCHRFL